MAKPLIAGNWKMHCTVSEGVELVMKLRELVKGVDEVEVVIAPPFTALYHLNFLTADSPIRLAAQDLFWEESGPYTGEVSPAMVRDVGCDYVIVGHSERRALFGETDDTVNRKVHAALKAGLRPIVCVGETLDERKEGKTLARVRRQVERALSGVGPAVLKEVVIAYEPVWAIGTGLTATPGQAEEVHQSLRELLFELYDADKVKPARIIYGGSVKAANIDSLMACPNIDGALVGGASLKADEFARIVRFE
ncbi:MAG TPA: triose-phosphate isomerase [Deltaproteobacteria bacterium]|nr:triose-phosphate isomerase [Deltaproteobacteria bacterium]